MWISDNWIPCCDESRMKIIYVECEEEFYIIDCETEERFWVIYCPWCGCRLAVRKRMMKPCTDCDGAGHVPDCCGTSVCETCDGTGSVVHYLDHCE